MSKNHKSRPWHVLLREAAEKGNIDHNHSSETIKTFSPPPSHVPECHSKEKFFKRSEQEELKDFLENHTEPYFKVTTEETFEYFWEPDPDHRAGGQVKKYKVTKVVTEPVYLFYREIPATCFDMEHYDFKLEVDTRTGLPTACRPIVTPEEHAANGCSHYRSFHYPSKVKAERVKYRAELKDMAKQANVDVELFLSEEYVTS